MTADEKRLRLLGGRATQATLTLNDAIREMRGKGHSLRELAAWAGVSHQTIANICREEQA